MQLNFKSLQEKVDFLHKANRAYRDHNPIIDDDTYDYLERDVRKEDPDNLLFRNMEDDTFGLEHKLTIPMGSQDKALNLEEMNRFYNRIDTSEILSASEKLDGMSAELTYHNGHLVQILSRGNSDYGVNITSIVRGAQDLPLIIHTDKNCVVIRGEVIMKKSDLELLNIELIADGREPYQNTRNGTVGLVKALKNRKYSKYLSFRAFDIMGIN